MEEIGSPTPRLTLVAIAAACLAFAPAGRAYAGDGGAGWTIDTQQEWMDAVGDAGHFTVSDGYAAPTQDNATFESRVKSFNVKQQFGRISFEQSNDWGNWEAQGNLGPVAEPDAPVFISPAEHDYWYLNATSGGGQYHAWHSTDMQNWTHYGNVTGKDWVTTAEYADGKFYIYYDEPNDEDPHLLIDDDLTNIAHQDVGKVLNDPSHGSDAGVFRDKAGTFHLIYEDWSAINARNHSWDSQYAGHADSPDGINGFQPHEYPAPIDLRGNPTGATGSYYHPHNGWYSYDVYDGSKDAFGDYAMIQVGSTYYLFCDYHPEGGPVSLGYWKSDSLGQAFEWGGVIRQNLHPDPAVGFAEGQFVMFVQGGDDMASYGPWVDSIQVQVGVDTDGDGNADVWTDWQDVCETYSRIAGFARIIDQSPAELDLSSLPDGYGLQFRFRTDDAAATMDRIVLESAPIPEPTSLALLALAGLGVLRRRRRGGPA